MLASMGYERVWERLIEYLDDLGGAREVPGGIEVTVGESPGRTRTVEVVVSPQDWDGFISTLYGDGDPAVTTIKEKVLSVPEGVPYLVYDRICDWEPSAARELPADDFDPEMRGEWLVKDDAGNVIDRFGDRHEPK